MAVAEALDFPGAVTQGFDLADARLMIASALEDLAQALLAEGKALPVPSDEVESPDANLIELVPLSVYAGTTPTRIYALLTKCEFPPGPWLPSARTGQPARVFEGIFAEQTLSA